jgi:hypothetical protein
MITIANNKVFVQGKTTTDPILIGLAVLDSLDSKEDMISMHSDRRDKINAYFKAKRLRNTLERRCLVDIVCSMFIFSTDELVERAEKLHISRASAYNFTVLLIDANIVSKKEHLFI